MPSSLYLLPAPTGRATKKILCSRGYMPLHSSQKKSWRNILRFSRKQKNATTSASARNSICLRFPTSSVPDFRYGPRKEQFSETFSTTLYGASEKNEDMPKWIFPTSRKKTSTNGAGIGKNSK